MHISALFFKGKGTLTKTLETNSIFIYSACMLNRFSRVCLTLCNLMDCSPPGSSFQGILQARILECVVLPSSRGSSQPRDQTHISCSSCIAAGFFTTEPLRKPHSFIGALLKLIQKQLLKMRHS